jgi:dipeptidyl aminopeptidase/acylaminoacyl peptidase
MNAYLLITPLLFALGAPPPAGQAAAAPTAVPGMAPVPGNGNLLASAIPAIPPELRETVLQFQNARHAGIVDMTRDGKKLLISTRFGSTSQLHIVDHPMGARRQITFSEEPVSSGLFLPGNTEVVFYMQDVGGGEFYQIYRLDRRTGKSTLLTDGKSRHEALMISEDGRTIAYAGTGRNGKDTDVYVAPTARPQEAKRVVEAEGTWRPIELSRNGRKLLVRQFRSAEDSDLHLVDVATGERQLLTPDATKEGKASVGAAAFSHDAKSVYFVTDRYGDFNELYRIELGKKGPPKPLTRSIKWDVDEIAVAPDGSRVAFTVNEDGFGKLYLLAPSGRISPVTVPTGIIGGIFYPSRRSDVLGLSMQTANSPTDAYQVDLRTRKLVRWTQSEVGAVDTTTFAEPKLVRYPSTDGVTVPAFYFRSPLATGKSPVVVIFHGGPEGQSRPGFNPFVQLLLSQGISVLLPNVRGSDGYGKAYLAMDNGVKREASLADIGATFDWIGKQADLDAARVGVYGGSYGGYMVLAAVTFFPDRVKAGVDVVGISSLPTFLKNTQDYRRDLRRAEYGDERIPEVRAVQDRISPLNSVQKIEASLFVQQGKNDPRVPQSEAEQIVQALKGKGKDVWYLLALNEGHGYGKKENRDFATMATALFFREKLAPARSASLVR